MIGAVTDTWTLVVYPAAGVLLTVLIAVGATYPIWKDRRGSAEVRAARGDRLDATADAVLGREADWRRGVTRQVGLTETVSEMQKTIGTIGTADGSGRTVVELIKENTTKTERIGHGQSVLAERVEAHIDLDTARFAEHDSRLKRLEGDK